MLRIAPWLAVAAIACDAGAAPGRAAHADRNERERPVDVARAPTETPAPQRARAIASGSLEGVALRDDANDALRAAVRGDRAAQPRIYAAARLGPADGSHLVYALFATSESLERWARERTSGTYEASRRALDEAIASCEEDADPGCDGCQSCEERLDTEHYPEDVKVNLGRISFAAGRAPALDASVLVHSARASIQAQFREIADIDRDGRAELSIAVRDTFDNGQFGEETMTFGWYDGDTLHGQLSLDRRSWAFGCSGALAERSGFSVRDRNGDGAPDFGVRHAVWRAEDCEVAGWPDPSGTRIEDAAVVRRLAMGEPMAMILESDEDVDDPSCPYFEERTRYLYDAASDEWRLAPGD